MLEWLGRRVAGVLERLECQCLIITLDLMHFLIRKHIFTEYCETIEMPATKSDAHLLESGRKGLSVYIQEKGMELRVCGANGLSYIPSEWIHSGAFRTPKQPNLLVEDNQTSNYGNAGRYAKQRLEYASWERCFS
jgi:hypothetical protein